MVKYLSAEQTYFSQELVENKAELQAQLVLDVNLLGEQEHESK